MELFSWALHCSMHLCILIHPSHPLGQTNSCTRRLQQPVSTSLWLRDFSGTIVAAFLLSGNTLKITEKSWCINTPVPLLLRWDISVMWVLTPFLQFPGGIKLHSTPMVAGLIIHSYWLLFSPCIGSLPLHSNLGLGVCFCGKTNLRQIQVSVLWVRYYYYIYFTGRKWKQREVKKVAEVEFKPT